MATSISADSAVIELLKKQRPNVLPEPSAGATEYSAHELSHSTFPDVHYSEHEKGELAQWLTTSLHIASPSEDDAKTQERLSSLNSHLATRTTILGSKPSISDIAIYARLAPIVAKWSDEQKTGEQGYHHIVRHLLFVQDASIFGLGLPDSAKISVDLDKIVSPIKPIDAKAEKERKKREKAALAPETSAKENTKKDKKSTGDVVAAAVASSVPVAKSTGVVDTKNEIPAAADTQGEPKGKKKEKTAKPKKQPEPPKETPLSPALIDLRVGHILNAVQHPNADSLYVSTIAVGDPAGRENTSEYNGQICRTVCSGLNGLIPLEQMQGRKIVAVCNLKPVTMRGIKSAAMVLAASPRLAPGEQDDHKGPVELVEVPKDAVAGTRIWFEGWEGEPEAVLNPKKKIWESCQPGFTTTADGQVAFDPSAVEKLAEQGKPPAKLVAKSGGVCSVPTLRGATVR